MAQLVDNLEFNIEAFAPPLDRDPNVSPATGQLVVSYLLPVNHTVEIKRNGVSVISGYTAVIWYDPEWHESNTYELIATDTTDSSTLSTDVVYFPYYPVYDFEGSGYYFGSWQTASDKLAQSVIGFDNPVRILKQRIRHEIELQRFEGGLFEDIKHTNASFLAMRDQLIDLYPAISIQNARTQHSFANIAEDEDRLNFTVEAFGEDFDPFAMQRKIENTVYWLAWLIKRKYDWDGIGGAIDTVDIQTFYPDTANPVRENRFELRGRVEFTVIIRQGWQG